MGNESSVGGGDSSRNDVQHHRPSGGRRLGSGLDDSSDGMVVSQNSLGERKTFRDEYMLQSRIGTGSHSQVFRAVERATGNLVAVKAIHTDWLDRRRVEFLRAEIDVHNEVSRHPFVVRLLGVFDDSEAQFIVQELAEGGSLLDHLHSRPNMETEAEVRALLRRLLAAAQFLHGRGIVHRDIKPENLLVMREGDMSSTKLADFGFATRLNGESAVTGPACGTPEYVAPEILLQQPFCGKADVWSAGVTTFCLLSGVMPFHGHTLDKLYTAVLDGACSYAGAPWERVSASARDCVQCMLRVDPEERWTAAQLLEHPWIKGGGVGVGSRLDGRKRRRARLRTLGLAVVFLNRLLVRSGRATMGHRSNSRPLQELGSP